MPPSTLVPNVNGLGCSEAFAQISHAGLLPVVQFQKNSGVGWGLVIQTKPQPGTAAESKATVMLYVSAGDDLPPQKQVF